MYAYEDKYCPVEIVVFIEEMHCSVTCVSDYTRI